MTGSPAKAVLLLLAIACGIAALVCVASFFGACSTLVPGDTGGKGEWIGLVFALVLALCSGAAYRASRDS